DPTHLENPMTDQTTPRDRLFALIASIPGSASVDWCDDARALVNEIAAPPAPLPSADPSAETPREQLLAAIDGTRTPPLGYGSPEELLAAYDASRTPAADQTALRGRIAEALMSWAEGNNSPQYAAMRRPETVRANAYSRADAVLAALPAAPAAPGETAAAVLAVVETAGGDTLTPDARVEALAGITAVLPATTRHDTDTSVTPPPALTEEGRLRARVQVLEEDAERDQGLAATGARCLLRGHQGQIESGRATIEGHRFALSTTLGLGTGAPWDAIHERVAELRRVADETAATETPECAAVIARVRAITERAANNVQRPAARLARRILAELPDQGACPPRCPCHQPAAGARQDGADRG
ncbi:hypothetical protein ACWF8U_20515, partial [Streptomyces olivaceus]